MSTGFVWHERTMWHNVGPSTGALPSRGLYPPGQHYENADTKRRLKNLLDGYGVTDLLEAITPTPATLDQVRSVHDTDYIDRVKSLSDDMGGDAGEFALVGPGSFEIALITAGAAIAGAEAIADGKVKNAYVLTRPPGHHAEPDRGMGFCIFNNIGIAVRHLRTQGKVGKVAVVDWDVHHGNGTETVFYDDPETLTISLHQDGLYPHDRGGIEDKGTGNAVGTNINVPLPPGCGGGAYLHAIDEVVLPALNAFAPELVIIACGFDASVADPMSAMMLTSTHYRAMTGKVKGWVDANSDGKLLCVHEGGYSAEYVPFCGLAVIEQLSGIESGCVDGAGTYADLQTGQDLQPHQADAIAEAKKAAPLLN